MVILPPEPLWEPINAIRDKHDKQRVRWMPHINLVFPFVHPDKLDDERERLAEVAASVGAFELTLGSFHYFKHSSKRASVWLAPEPREPLAALNSALMARFPHLDISHRFEAGFTPHLSVGQTTTYVRGRRMVDEFNETWTPLTFEVDALTVLRRTNVDPFEVAFRVALTG